MIKVDNQKVVFTLHKWNKIDCCYCVSCYCGGIGIPKDIVKETNWYEVICPNCGERICLLCVTEEDHNNGFRIGMI